MTGSNFSVAGLPGSPGSPTIPMHDSSFLKTALSTLILVGSMSLPLLAQNPVPSPSSPSPGRPDHVPPFRRPPNPLMEALDTNHDGVLSAEEIAAAPTSLKKLDKNSDGQLTEDELRPPPPGGRGGLMRGQLGPEGPGANRAGSRDEMDPRLPPPPFIGQGPTAPDATPHDPNAAVRPQRPPPRLEEDPVAARLDQESKGTPVPTPRPAASPLTLFDLLDTNHDGTLSEEELRNAPAMLKQLDLKSIPLPSGPAAGPGERRPLPPQP